MIRTLATKNQPSDLSLKDSSGRGESLYEEAEKKKDQARQAAPFASGGVQVILFFWKRVKIM